MKKIFSCLILLLLLISSFNSIAADDFESKFLQGKEYLKQKRYTLAMEVFRPLVSEAPGNKYVEYAHYFYALSAFKAAAYKDASFMLLLLTDGYKSWDKIDEAYYLWANVAFEQKKYRPAIRYLQSVGKNLSGDVEKMKAYYYRKVISIDTLINLQKSFPSDLVLAKTLANRLSFMNKNEKQRMLFEYLIQEYKIEKSNQSAGKAIVNKSSYKVAVLFPFMIKDASNGGTVRNQFAYEMYEGIRIAVDSLKNAGGQINLYAYDVEKDNGKLAEVLKLPELTSMDMIIGPIYPSQYGMVNEFGLKNQILVVNPLSNNSNMAGSSIFTLMFQPALENIAGQAAQYASQNFKNNPLATNVIIIQSPTLKDSIIANSFRDSIKTKGFNIKYHEVINKDNIKRVQEIFRDSLMLTKVSHVFVSSTDQVLAANIISSLEISALNIPVVTGAEWLQFSLLTYSQFERRGVHFIDPEFLDYDNPSVSSFRKNYVMKNNILPSIYAYQGYDMMNLFGNFLFQYGNYFIEGLREQGFIQGATLPGFNYSTGNSNGFVPIVKFADANLTIMNSPVTSFVIEEDIQKK